MPTADAPGTTRGIEASGHSGLRQRGKPIGHRSTITSEAFISLIFSVGRLSPPKKFPGNFNT